MICVDFHDLYSIKFVEGVEDRSVGYYLPVINNCQIILLRLNLIIDKFDGI